MDEETFRFLMAHRYAREQPKEIQAVENVLRTVLLAAGVNGVLIGLTSRDGKETWNAMAFSALIGTLAGYGACQVVKMPQFWQWYFRYIEAPHNHHQYHDPPQDSPPEVPDEADRVSPIPAAGSAPPENNHE